MTIHTIKKCLLLIGICSLTPLSAQVDHWESIILPEDEFSYLIPDAQPDINWITEAFDDSEWQTGPSGFGYGDDDDNTIVEDGTLTIYVRRIFEIVDIDDIEQVILDIDFDDGFVAYINGQEVGRMLVSGSVPGYDQPADDIHEALLYLGANPERFEIPPTILKNGTNILSVEVHNESVTSSDLTLIPTLSFGIKSASANYRPVPSWFNTSIVSDFESSNLPIIIIETRNGREIQDEPKVFGTMKILSNSEGKRNYLQDQSNDQVISYEGIIAIEIRGSSSQTLPKKQYLFTTYDEEEKKDNVTLLGMPKENDWILNGLAFDPSLIRDYLCYELYRRMGEYSSRAKYCELIVNGQYRGLYMLMEKLKADDNRIDIKKIGDDDLEGEDLTGGYITKLDKIEGNDVIGWSSPNYLGGMSNFVHELPKPNEIHTNQHKYIKGVFDELGKTAQDRNSSIIDGYPSIIDIPSFLKFILINELSANVDAYEFSTYFHKDKNGKLRAGPIWDHNLTFGNDLRQWGYDRSFTDVWQFDNGDNVGPKFWKDLYDDDVFRCHLSRQWSQLTSPGGVLSKEKIFDLIDSLQTEIFEASQREKSTWNTFNDLDNNLVQIKRFIEIRSEWMTQQLGPYDACKSPDIPSLVISKIQYHPKSPGSTDENDLEFIEISNAGNESINLNGIYFGGTGLVYQFPFGEKIDGGEKITLAGGRNSFFSHYQSNPYDEFTRSLDNGGQTIKLLDAFGNVIDEVTYDDLDPWPTSADGKGSYLELIDLNSDNSDPTNWKAVDIELVLSLRTEKDEIMVYPNPAKTLLRIDSKSGIQRIEIHDSHGHLVGKFKLIDQTREIILPDLKTGLYFLRIESEKGWITRKLIINN